MPQTKNKVRWEDLVPNRLMTEEEVLREDTPEAIDAVGTRADTPQSAINAPGMIRPFSTIVDMADAMNKTMPREWHGKFVVFLGTTLVNREHGQGHSILYLSCDMQGRKDHGVLGLTESFSKLTSDRSKILLGLVAQ